MTADLSALGRRGLKARLRRLTMWREMAACGPASKKRRELLERLDGLRKAVLDECERRARLTDRGP